MLLITYKRADALRCAGFAHDVVGLEERLVDGPLEPTMIPVRSLEMSVSDNPEVLHGLFIAMKV